MVSTTSSPGHLVTVTVAVAELFAWSGSGLRDRPAAQTHPASTLEARKLTL